MNHQLLQRQFITHHHHQPTTHQSRLTRIVHPLLHMMLLRLLMPSQRLPLILHLPRKLLHTAHPRLHRRLPPSHHHRTHRPRSQSIRLPSQLSGPHRQSHLHMAHQPSQPTTTHHRSHSHNPQPRPLLSRTTKPTQLQFTFRPPRLSTSPQSSSTRV